MLPGRAAAQGAEKPRALGITAQAAPATAGGQAGATTTPATWGVKKVQTHYVKKRRRARRIRIKARPTVYHWHTNPHYYEVIDLYDAPAHDRFEGFGFQGDGFKHSSKSFR